MQKNAYVTFTHTVILEDVEGMTEEEIQEKAVDMFNELPLDDIYKSESDIFSIEILEEESEEE